MALARETAQALSTPTCPINVRASTEVWAEADPDRLRQALENLMSNALKHSPDGAEVWVEVSSERREDGEWATVSVRDSGPGISDDLMPRLFTRFASGPGSTGLGLGLYLAQGIARAHGGALTAESEPGRGATFTLALPIATGE